MPLAETDINSIHYHSQEVRPKGLFTAISGFSVNGHDYIDDAVKRGAQAVLTQAPVDCNATVIQVEDTRKALSAVSDRFYDHPSHNLFIIGITGTNGKTTCTYLMESILKKAGVSVGVISTINYRYAGRVFDNPVTTPESLDLHRILAEMLAAGVSHVIFEISSHAIDLHRIDDCRLDVGVFTNLSQDHLDYHKSMDAYWACKKRLFARHLVSGPKKDRAMAVINANHAKGKELLEELSLACISVGSDPSHTVSVQDVSYGLSGIDATVKTPQGTLALHSPLMGRHNLENILCAVGVGLALDLDPEAIRAGIEALTFVPGRLERIPDLSGLSDQKDRFVFVDYAHTPDALENVILSLRALAQAKIICVFGCGGDRDADKRPRMGEIAGKLCDLAIITSDNPRNEEPLAIIDQIVAGVSDVCPYQYPPDALKAGIHQKGYVVEANRKKAIRLGITAAQAGDIVLIAGKGHETYQIIGKKINPFDDRIEAAHALLL